MEELRQAYKSGITASILGIVFLILLISLAYINNYIAILIINILSFIILALILSFYFKMMMGYVYIGERYSKGLKKSTYGILICIIILFLLLILLYFVNIEKNITLTSVISMLILIVYLIFAILKIIFGITAYKAPVKSNTKSTLSIFSMLFGISLITILPLIFIPYIKTMEIVFQILFLKDTYKKDHKNKKARNLWWWITSLVIYLVLIGVMGYLIYKFTNIWQSFS